MKLYDKNGYVNIPKILSYGLPFNFVVGGRGTGKTYGALKYLLEEKIKFMLMRRTQTQIDMVNKKDFSPFKSVCRDMGAEIVSVPITKNNAAFYYADANGKASGDCLGFSCALSTISNMRGFDASDAMILVYDEFIPEKHERPLKNEATAFANAYETINRNRELKGEKPLIALCLANANDLANPLFVEFGLVKIAERMQATNQEIYIDRKKGVGLFFTQESPVSKNKSDTALYRFTENSEFSGMSLNNEFTADKPSRIGSRPLAEYRPIVCIGELCIYRHKSKQEYYATTHKSGTCPTFDTSKSDIARFKKSFGWLWMVYIKNNIVFEEYLCEIYLTKFLAML